ncbi:MAG: ABC transporter substrate-binding protein [Chloroflexi bacterium]|nr:ABC transporter substrate-binding protein [Chloroflexota bacterium]
MRKFGIFLALSMALIILTAGCAKGEIKEEKGVAVRGNFIDGESGGDAETLNWILAADASSFSYAGHTLDSLATYDNQLNIQLRCLAKDVEVSPDGLVYTITIRDDLKWSDSSPVTAEDYVYTMKNLMFSDWLNYNYKSDWQEEMDGKTAFVAPQAVNTTTFTITRQTVYPEFIYRIYNLIPYPKNIATKYEGDVKAFTEAPEFNNLTYTGNLGPYRFKEWIRNDRFVVERNTEYYLGKDVGAPYFEQYTIKLFGTPATRQAALEAGDITETGIEPAEVNRFRSLPNIKVYTVPTSGYTLVAYNQRANGWEGLKDKTVRQALSMAISKQTISQAVLLGFAEPAFSFIPATSPWYTDEGVAKYGVGTFYDKQKAAEFLYQEGYGTRKDDGAITVTNKDGSTLHLILAVNTGSKPAEDMAFFVRKELLDLGIETEIKLVPWATLLRQYVMNTAPKSKQEPAYNNGPDAVSQEPWDLIIMGFGTDLLAPSGSHVFFATQGGLNLMGYSNPEVDKLFNRARSKEALDKEVRKQIYAELSRVLSEEQPVDFLIFHRANVGFQKNVMGIEPGINMGYNYHLWYFEPIK